MSDFIWELISVAILFALAYAWLARSPSRAGVEYWTKIMEEGHAFLQELKDMQTTFEEFSMLSDKLQDEFTVQIGFDPERIDLFVELAEEFPNESLLRPGQSKVYREYRVTRQAIRRMPGASGFKMGPL